MDFSVQKVKVSFSILKVEEMMVIEFSVIGYHSKGNF
jgi:hypothetical protein